MEKLSVFPAGIFHLSVIWLEDYGATISEPFVVINARGKRLSHAPGELIVVT